MKTRLSDTTKDDLEVFMQEDVEAKSAEKKDDYSSTTLIQSQQAETIAKIFQKAIASCLALSQTPDKKKFAKAVEDLQKKVLTRFKNGDPLFNFNKSTYIANTILALANRVDKDRVTDNDCKFFDKMTREYRSDKGVAIVLATILGIVTGMIAGMAAGFVSVGLISGGVLGASAAFWYTRKQDPVIQVSQAAKAAIKAPKN